MRGEISIKLLQAYSQNENIKLKTSKAPAKSTKDEAEG
jgi:hypothetical protein